MEKINNIAAFCKDKCILALLKGYFYANNINMTVADFNVHEINEVAKHKPDLILVQLNWVNARRIETNLLRLVASRDQVKICCLNTKLNPVISSELPVWIDGILNNPFDIAEIAEYIKKKFFSDSCLSNNQNHHEKYSVTEGSCTESNNNCADNEHDEDQITGNTDFQQEICDPGFTHFKIDQKKKCLFINGDNVYLTPKEFDLIKLLLSDIDRVFLNDEIINRLWPENHRATKSDLYQYMHLLRKKIEKNLNNPQIIITVRGFGYKMNIDCTKKLINR